MARKRQHIPSMFDSSFIGALCISFDVEEFPAEQTRGQQFKYLEFEHREQELKQRPPEVKLWSYCVLDAIRQASTGDGESFGWLFIDDDQEVIGTFDWVCDTLEINKLNFQERLLDGWEKIKILGHNYNRLSRDLQ